MLVAKKTKKGDGHLGSISAHGKLFIKSHEFGPVSKVKRTRRYRRMGPWADLIP